MTRQRAAALSRVALLGPLVVVCFLGFFLAFTPSEAESRVLSLGLRTVPFLVVAIAAIAYSFNAIALRPLGLAVFVLVIGLLMAKGIADFSIYGVVAGAVYASAYALSLGVWSSEVVRGCVVAALTAVISLWVLALAMQLIGYLAGWDLSLHTWIFPESEQRVGAAFAAVRLGGIHNEPGTYSNWVYGAVLIRAVLTGRMFSTLHTVAILSMAVTLSFWGAAVAGIYAFMLLGWTVTRQSGAVARAVVLTVEVAIVAGLFLVAYAALSDSIIPYFQARAEASDYATLSKVEVFAHVAETASDWILYGRPFEELPCQDCISPQDAGVGVNALYYFGAIFMAIAVGIVHHSYRMFGVPGVVFVLPLFIAKYTYWDPVFAMAVVSILTAQHQQPDVDVEVWKQDAIGRQSR